MCEDAIIDGHKIHCLLSILIKSSRTHNIAQCADELCAKNVQNHNKCHGLFLNKFVYVTFKDRLQKFRSQAVGGDTVSNNGKTNLLKYNLKIENSQPRRNILDRHSIDDSSQRSEFNRTGKAAVNR